MIGRAGRSAVPYLGTSLLGDQSPDIAGAEGISDGDLDVAIDTSFAAGLGARYDYASSERLYLTGELRYSSRSGLDLDGEGDPGRLSNVDCRPITLGLGLGVRF